MKKIFSIIAVAIASMGIANAQLGIVGGLTMSSTEINTEDWAANAKEISLYHVGLAYKVDLGLGLALQPSLTYEMKGASLEENISVGDVTAATNTIETKSGYGEFAMDLQWGLDLVAFRPFVFASPYVGYLITQEELNSWGSAIGSTDNNDTITNEVESAKNKLEYGFGIGAGVDVLQHVQLKVQYYMNLGSLYNEGKMDGNSILTAVKNSYGNIENYNGIKATLAIFF